MSTPNAYVEIDGVGARHASLSELVRGSASAVAPPAPAARFFRILFKKTLSHHASSGVPTPDVGSNDAPPKAAMTT